VHRAENIAVVGHGHSGHAKLFYTMAKLLDVTGAVEHGIVSVKVKVNELGHSDSSSLLWRARGAKAEIWAVEWKKGQPRKAALRQIEP
jgi:hypothetical protein